MPNWKDISPRVGATYDLFGNGKTVVRGNYGQYLASESTNMATLNNPVNTSINTATPHVDRHQRQLLPGLRSHQPGRSTASAGCSARRSARSTSSRNIDPAMLSGWGVRPNDHEIDFGMAYSITHSLALDGSTPITGSAISSRPRIAPIPRRTTTATA